MAERRDDPIRPDAPYGRDPRVATLGGKAGPAPSFDLPHPRTYGRPARDRLKAAYLAYVQGHDRGWEAERKRREAEATLRREAESSPRTPEGEPRDAGGGPAPSGLAAAAEDRPAAPTAAACFGVPVPERLDFHRGPDTWRDRGRGGSGRP